MRHDPVVNEALPIVANRVRNLHAHVTKQLNRKSLTLPIYDLPGNPPTDALEGQVAHSRTGKLWWYIDGEWRTC